MNTCKKYDISCKLADENGDCTFNHFTKDGMFITGELFCESEDFVVKHIPFRKNIYKPTDEEFAKLKAQVESWYKNAVLVNCCCCGVEQRKDDYNYRFNDEEICDDCIRKIKSELMKRQAFTEADLQQIFDDIRRGNK